MIKAAKRGTEFSESNARRMVSKDIEQLGKTTA